VIVYWLLFLYFAAGAIREQPRPAETARADILFRLGCLLTALMIGLRFHVGADWSPTKSSSPRRETRRWGRCR